MKSRAFRILVVDDDEDVGYLFRRLLGGPPEVSWATDGYEAIAKTKQDASDLFFVNVRLPSIDGIATLRRLKALAPDAVYIMMSGHAVGQEVEEALALGAQDYIEKPFRDLSEIITIERVARYLSLHDLSVQRLARETVIPGQVGLGWRAGQELLGRWIRREILHHRQARAV
jgi:CheY-like chemotaxis protein